MNKKLENKTTTNLLDNLQFEIPTSGSKLYKVIKRWRKIVFFVAIDWIFLALLGIIMAVCSLAMNETISYLQKFHLRIIGIAKSSTEGVMNIALTYVVWIAYAIILVTSSALFVHYFGPQAIGSGIPEMKTILRGVILKEYLTLRTLISKMVGLTLSVGSGIPIGKEGPFVHVASVVANLLSRAVQTFHGVYSNESRRNEMLAAGCAVGVACTFSSPVGGVLFSIEVTSVYFAIRNYWRGFFAATCSATVFRLLQVPIETEVTLRAFSQTAFPTDAFLPEELPFFAFIGFFCGVLSAFFIFLHRHLMLFLRQNKYAKTIFQQFWLIYSLLVSFIIASITYPNGFGMFLGGDMRFSQTPDDLLRNCTWTAPNTSTLYCKNVVNWKGPGGEYSVFISLACFIVTYFLLTLLASTLPIPAGIFQPTFVLGAAMGRIMGEFVAVLYPTGLRGPNALQTYPGVYAVVGAAAFCGGVTHTVSVAVIIFEMTGQIFYILPVMIAVLIANAISSYLQPSIYDSMIKIKNLPYLPDIPATSSSFHGIRAEQIMTRNVRYLSKESTYAEVQRLMLEMPKLRAFPIVEDKKSMILIGSCSRHKFLHAIETKIGREARQTEANRRIKQAIENSDFEQKNFDNKRDNLSERRPSILSPEFTNLMGSSPDKGSDDRNVSGLSCAKSMPTRRLNDWMMGESESHEDILPANMNIISEGNGRQASRFTIVPVSDIENESISKSKVCENAALPNISFSDIEPEQIKRNSSMNSLRSCESSQTQRNSLHKSASEAYKTIEGIIRTISHLSLGRRGKRSSREEDYDLVGEERKAWEQRQLAERIDLSKIGIDPSPFQLVEHSSLIKVHSLFSLLGLHRAYVTDCGKLVGVVSLRDLRLAIERAQNGLLLADSLPIYNENIVANQNQIITRDLTKLLYPPLKVFAHSNSEKSRNLPANLLKCAELGLTLPFSNVSQHPTILRTNSDSFIIAEQNNLNHVQCGGIRVEVAPNVFIEPILKRSRSLNLSRPSPIDAIPKKFPCNSILL